jgi:hypothetical protein
MKTEKKIVYFDKPGKQNTGEVIKIVKRRLLRGDIKNVVVASITGFTALKLGERIARTKPNLVCVTAGPKWSTLGYEGPLMKPRTKEKLKDLGYRIIDCNYSGFHDGLNYALERYGFPPDHRPPLSWIMAETLESIGGYGLKTAVEIILTAAHEKIIPKSVKVLSVAGTDRGADTAIVATSCLPEDFFSKNSKKRFQLKEILAMPMNKKWYKHIKCDDYEVDEVK